jgi:hypothetical protein
VVAKTSNKNPGLQIVEERSRYGQPEKGLPLSIPFLDKGIAELSLSGSLQTEAPFTTSRNFEKDC